MSVMGNRVASWIERFRTRPTAPAHLAPIAVVVWIAGALYCSGYERLTTGFDNWPGSLIWSAVAVLPWLAVFEWAKSARGRRVSMARVVLLFLFVVAASVAAELVVNYADGNSSSSLALLIMRRLPAIGVSLLLVIWSRTARDVEQEQRDAEDLSSFAKSIDWVAAADNYVELHISGRTMIRRMTMRQAERALARHGFVRIHRRFLVNRERIASVGAGERRQSVRLSGGSILPVGRSFAANLQHR